jgi:hypothetical protein
MRERCDNGEGIYTAMNLDSGLYGAGIRNRYASVFKGASKTWFPKLVSTPARWRSNRFAQTAAIVNQPFSFTLFSACPHPVR